MSDHLARVKEMQAVLDVVTANHAQFVALVDKLPQHFEQVEILSDYLSCWGEDYDALWGGDVDAATADALSDLPILGEDPLFDAVQQTAVLVRQLLSICSAHLESEIREPDQT